MNSVSRGDHDYCDIPLTFLPLLANHSIRSGGSRPLWQPPPFFSGTIFPLEPDAASGLQGTWARVPAPSLGSHSADFPFNLWLGANWEGKDLVLSVNAFLCNAGLNDYFYSSFYKIFPQNFYRLIAKHHYPSILTHLPNMHVLQVTMLSRHQPCPACHAPGWWVCLQPSH